MAPWLASITHGAEAAEGHGTAGDGKHRRDFLYGAGRWGDTLYAAGGRRAPTGGRGGDTVFDFD